MVRRPMVVIVRVIMVMMMVVMADSADMNVVRLVGKATEKEPAAQACDQQATDERKQALDLLRCQAGILQDDSDHDYRAGMSQRDDQAQQDGMPGGAALADKVRCYQSLAVTRCEGMNCPHPGTKCHDHPETVLVVKHD